MNFKKVELPNVGKTKVAGKIKKIWNVIKVVVFVYILVSVVYSSYSLVSYVKTLRVSASIISVQGR